MPEVIKSAHAYLHVSLVRNPNDQTNIAYLAVAAYRVNNTPAIFTMTETGPAASVISGKKTGFMAILDELIRVATSNHVSQLVVTPDPDLNQEFTPCEISIGESGTRVELYRIEDNNIDIEFKKACQGAYDKLQIVW